MKENKKQLYVYNKAKLEVLQHWDMKAVAEPKSKPEEIKNELIKDLREMISFPGRVIIIEEQLESYADELLDKYYIIPKIKIPMYTKKAEHDLEMINK